jgi:GNAT superfamily N-acetyltransferase
MSVQFPHAHGTRPQKATDEPSIAALLSAVHAQNPAEVPEPTVHGPAVDERGNFRRTLVVEADDVLIDVGTIWEHWLHPARWRLALHVHPNRRRRGVGTALLKRLVGMIPAQDARPLQAATSADNAAGRQFLHRAGFDLLMRTRLGMVGPGVATVAIRPEIDNATERLMRTGYRIATLSDLGSGTFWTDALADLQAEIYRLGHDWNPPAPLTTADARHLFMDEADVIPEALFVGLLDNRPVALASLRRGETPDELDLGWVGVAARHRDLRNELTVVLLGQCLAYAAGRYGALSARSMRPISHCGPS